mmetsp:Transcript_60926/g.107038  ORF Transcript_60926/g.107038 Transcript_60926/m.107038 type:complete len:307 (-) Transcript_60926:1321-2241(-)
MLQQALAGGGVAVQGRGGARRQRRRLLAAAVGRRGVECSGVRVDRKHPTEKAFGCTAPVRLVQVGRTRVTVRTDPAGTEQRHEQIQYVVCVDLHFVFFAVRHQCHFDAAQKFIGLLGEAQLHHRRVEELTRQTDLVGFVLLLSLEQTNRRAFHDQLNLMHGGFVDALRGVHQLAQIFDPHFHRSKEVQRQLRLAFFHRQFQVRKHTEHRGRSLLHLPEHFHTLSELLAAQACALSDLTGDFRQILVRSVDFVKACRDAALQMQQRRQLDAMVGVLGGGHDGLTEGVAEVIAHHHHGLVVHHGTGGG